MVIHLSTTPDRHRFHGVTLSWLICDQRHHSPCTMLTCHPTLWFGSIKRQNNVTPTYLADLCRSVASVGGRQRLRSATRGDLVVSPTVTHFGARSFAVAGPKACNHLPADIRASDSVNSFKSALKTFLFR